MEPATVRIRTVFEDRKMLSKSQRSSGLKRSWLLLKPEHHTISDLTSHLIHAFELRNAYPNGIVLSMEGYVLPPFESTCILKDKDIISVSKKRGALMETIELGDEENSLEVEDAEKQPERAGLKLLANEEFEKEVGGYESEPEEDETDHSEDVPQVEITPVKSKASKKRKASKEHQSPKRKKSKRTSIEEHVMAEDVGTDTLASHSKSSRHDRVLSRKNLVKKEKVCLAQTEKVKLKASRIEETSDDSSTSSPNAKSSCSLDENGEKLVSASQTPGETGKVPSRSARRKKAKRQWLRLMNQEKKEVKQTFNQSHQQSHDKENIKLPETRQQPEQNNDEPCKAAQVFSDKHQKSDQNGDAEECYVPVVIRPGHIRFKPLGEDDDVQQNNPVPEETFQWNGITSKKKGQKWGMEKQSSSKRSHYRNPSPDSPESSKMVIAEGLSANGPLDFDKLAPYTSMPKEGDVIAYRLIELSSSWTPEISSFRVGKISKYDPGSNNMLLTQVPEYPIAFEKEMDEEASELQPDTSLYAEDGTLEINFLSLVDIRSVKHGNLDSTQAVTGAVNGVPAEVCDVNADNVNAPVPAKEKGDVWEELSQALIAKKAQLENPGRSAHEDGSSKKENSGRSSSSFRGRRSSALGPTMSNLRAQNIL